MKTETLNTQKLRTFVRFFLLKDEPAQPLLKKKKEKKKRTICTHHKGHLRWLSQQNPMLFVLIVHEQGIVLHHQGLEEISSNCFIVVRSTL